VVQLTTTHKPYGASVREVKAAATDKIIKNEIAAKSAKQMSKIARLKAQRLALEEADAPA
jgi:hypothetical protein